jgi:hypothetical protein
MRVLLLLLALTLAACQSYPEPPIEPTQPTATASPEPTALPSREPSAKPTGIKTSFTKPLTVKENRYATACIHYVD